MKALATEDQGFQRGIFERSLKNSVVVRTFKIQFQETKLCLIFCHDLQTAAVTS